LIPSSSRVDPRGRRGATRLPGTRRRRRPGMRTVAAWPPRSVPGGRRSGWRPACRSPPGRQWPRSPAGCGWRVPADAAADCRPSLADGVHRRPLLHGFLAKTRLDRQPPW